MFSDKRTCMPSVNYLQQEESLRKLPQGVRWGDGGGKERRYPQHTAGTVDMQQVQVTSLTPAQAQ